MPKKALAQRGRAMRRNTPGLSDIPQNRAKTRPISSSPTANPSKGLVIIGTTTFQSTPALWYQGSAGCDQMTALQRPSLAAMAAPASPPTRAWEEEEGRPTYQVVRFQTIPPARAHTITWEVTSTTAWSIRPEAMVFATAVPQSAPIRLATAASPTACIGESTLVATTVAMEFAVSWKPLMYSKTSAVTSTRMRVESKVVPLSCSSGRSGRPRCPPRGSGRWPSPGSRRTP